MNKDPRGISGGESGEDMEALTARRQAMKRILTTTAATAAAAPMVTMLFNPKKALAAGEGSGTEEP